MKTLSLCLLLSGSLVSVQGFAEDCAPSWCKTAKVKLNPTEQAICKYPELQTADQLLNQIYQTYRNTLASEAQKELLESQKKWRIERDKLSGKQELMSLMLERMMELNFMSSTANQP